MKTKIKLAIMAAALIMAAQANAQLYDIGFTASDNSILMNGTVFVDNTGVATSGSMTVVTGPAGLVGETFPLVPTSGPGVSTSPALGGYVVHYDNLVTPAGDPFLTVYGLLFSADESVLDLNLWANGAGNNGYETASLYGSGVLEDVTGGASISLAPVPEPTTIISGVLMLLPFGASTLRILRKRQAA
jgi:hypothetical protein